jgi:hypothetical protein
LPEPCGEKEDADLNGAYQRIVGVLTASDRQKLQSAERTWLTYRDQTCVAERDLYEGGTGGHAAYPACLEALTRHRIIELKQTYWWKVENFVGEGLDWSKSQERAEQDGQSPLGHFNLRQRP